MNVTDLQINEIYNVIDKVGNKVNIQDVPVVFSKTDFIQDAIEIEDGEAVEETSNLPASEENLMELNNSSNNDSDNSSSSGEGKSSAIRGTFQVLNYWEA